MSQFSFKSACAPPFLPVNHNNKIKYEVIPKYFDYLYENGVRTLFLNGGCGEFSSLTVNERKQILEKWNKVIKDDVQIVVNIGTSNLADTIELGNHALSYKRLYAVAIVPPFYMPINNEENLLDYLMTVADGLNQKVPILYYHIPSVSKVNIDIENFLKLVKKNQFYQLAAMKFTDSNFEDLQTFLDGIQSNDLSINIYCGNEPFLCDSIKAGVKGAILGFANIKPALINSAIANNLSDTEMNSILALNTLFHATVEFAELHRVNIVGLLKIATEFYSNIELGPMKKPYTIAKEYVVEYRDLLTKMKF